MRTLMFVLLATAAFAAKDDERLKSVNRVSIEGKGPAADRAREYLQNGDSCFVVTDAENAEAYLEFHERAVDSSMGIMTILGSQPQKAIEGNLILRTGETLWSSIIPLHPRTGNVNVTVDYMIKQITKKASCKDRVIANKSESKVAAGGKNGDSN